MVLDQKHKMLNFIPEVQMQEHSVVEHLTPYHNHLLGYLFYSKTVFTILSFMIYLAFTQDNSNWLRKRKKREHDIVCLM